MTESKDNNKVSWDDFMPEDGDDIYDPIEDDQPSEPTTENGEIKSWFPNLNLNPRKKNNE